MGMELLVGWVVVVGVGLMVVLALAVACHFSITSLTSSLGPFHFSSPRSEEKVVGHVWPKTITFYLSLSLSKFISLYIYIYICIFTYICICMAYGQ